MEILKNKKLLGIVGIFVVLAILGGVYLLTQNKNAAPSLSDEITSDADLPKLTPEDIGMVVTVRPDKKALMFKLNKTSDIQKVEYTIEYDKEIDGETVPEGIFGEMKIAEDGRTDTDFREFGTCSAGKCRYDNVVSDIKIVLKVSKKDGKDYQVEKIVKL